MKRLICMMACVLAGCALGTSVPQRYYVLGASLPSTSGAPEDPARPVSLALMPTSASVFYDTPRIVFSQAPTLRAYYQYNHWTEPPARRIDALLADRLSHDGRFHTVALDGDSPSGSVVLSVRLEEIYHDASTRPGRATISLTATLSDPRRHAIVARRSFSATAPVPSYDAAGAVSGFDAVLAPLLDDVASWIAIAAQERSTDRAAAGGDRSDTLR